MRGFLAEDAEGSHAVGSAGKPDSTGGILSQVLLLLLGELLDTDLEYLVVVMVELVREPDDLFEEGPDAEGVGVLDAVVLPERAVREHLAEVLGHFEQSLFGE